MIQTEADVIALMTAEITGAFRHGIVAGARLVMRDYSIDVCSQSSAICRITFDFKPARDGQYAGKDFTFTNRYGYRAEGRGVKKG